MSSHEELDLPSSQKNANQVTGQSRLPNEILITIVQFVHGQKELYNLCLSNRLARKIVTPILYLHHFGYCQWAKKPNLYFLIKHPQFEHMVNTFSIRLNSINCRSQGEVDPSSPSQCSCLTLNEKLGAVLIYLRNLKVLRIVCSLTHEPDFGRHRYLEHLETRVLQRVQFTCHCGQLELKRLLVAPCMSSVTSWSLCLTEGHLDHDNNFKSFLMETRVLPNLQELHYYGSDLDFFLLQHRQISRLRETAVIHGPDALLWSPLYNRTPILYPIFDILEGLTFQNHAIGHLRIPDYLRTLAGSQVSAN
ncbi:hypothetical protein CPB86DRAFT_781622 [Serendipita vermifera]|nr:hypothetical protein CPB86DRAFT_781622 [Serendipita vermifera]